MSSNRFYKCTFKCNNVLFYIHVAGTVSCDFETASLCGYTNVAHKSGSFDWSRHKGPTASASTGPAADHTTGRGENFKTRLRIKKIQKSNGKVNHQKDVCLYYTTIKL